MKKDDEFLVETAIRAREMAYCEYSKFAVGAALRALGGEIFSGCNVENLSYGLTICAERVAIGSAVAAGEREFETIAVVADTRLPISPCGACRQVLAEFGDCRILLVNLKGDVVETSIAEMLPRSSTGILDRD
jgi:cytidine deaminase